MLHRAFGQASRLVGSVGAISCLGTSCPWISSRALLNKDRLSFSQKKWLVQISLSEFRTFSLDGMILDVVFGLIMQLLIWFVNSNAANAFFTSVIGLLFGPVFPSTLTLATMVLPEETHMVSMALL